MQKRVSELSRLISSFPTVRIRETVRSFVAIKDYLTRFGYLDAKFERSDILDETTSMALLKFQGLHKLPVTGIFDEATRDLMMRSRCGLPDLNPATGVAASTICAWNKDTLTYAFVNGTSDVSGDEERRAVRRAFATWSAAVQIAFREVGTGDDPDIRIDWTQANCGDTNMTGSTLAHADYPPGCGFYGNNRPRPCHFDDQEHTWCIGMVSGEYDVESIALHEIGHILGLGHSTDHPEAVMYDYSTANSTKRVLSEDDLHGVRKLYPLRGPIFARHSGRCLDIAGISTSNGADAHQWEYWGGWNQLFTVQWMEGSHYRLVAQHSNKVIDVDGISHDDGASFHQWDWWNGDNQKFRLEPVDSGYYRLVAKHSNKCMDVEAIAHHSGARIHQWHWWGGYNQQWRLGPAPIFSRHSGKCLDVEAISVDNGARIIQWDYWGGGNQKFRLDPVGDGFYRILIEHTGKCLDVEGISTANGARIIQWEYWGGDNQKFRPEHTGDGYYRLVAKHSGKCIDVAGISAFNGAVIHQWDWWGGANQQWRL